ncbi:MAG: FeoA family protein [Eubacteriales bacterium]|nr:FeoA family protein [Eubacteriales bacterium]
MLPITMASAGDRVTVKKITGNDKIRAHLAELGFVVNADVTVVSKIGKNLILQVKESRIALDESMANRIMVEI